MNLDTVTVMNLKSRLDSSPTSPTDGGALVWNDVDKRYDPSPLKTIGGETIVGSGDIQAGGAQAFYVVDLVATANVPLSGSATIDGVSSAGKRVLLTGQADPTQNGVYQDVGGVWTRLTDKSTGASLHRQYFYVEDGSANWNTYWRNTNASAPAIGTDAVTFESFDFQDKLVSGVNLKTVNGLPLTSGTNIPTSSVALTGKEVSLLAAENLYPGDLAYVSADGTKAARGYGAELTSDWYGVAGGVMGGVYNMPSTLSGMDATNIPSGGSNYYYGKVYVLHLVRGVEAYGRLIRVYKKSGTDNLVYSQLGTMTASGPVWSGPENSFDWTATAIWGVYAVGYDRIVVHTGGNFNSTTSSFLWSGQFDSSGVLTKKNYYNLDSLADTKGADLCDMTLPAQYTENGASRFLLSIKYGTTFQTRVCSISGAGVITSGSPILTGFSSVLSTGNNILGRQVVKCLRISDFQALHMAVNSSLNVVARSVTLTGDTTFTYGGTDRLYSLNTCILFDAVTVSYGLPAKILVAYNSRYGTMANEIAVRLFTTAGGDVAPTGGTYNVYNGPIRSWGDGSGGSQSNPSGNQPTHLKIYKTGVTPAATTVMVVARAYDSTSTLERDCFTSGTAIIPFVLSSTNSLDCLETSAAIIAHASGYDGWSQYDGVAGSFAIQSGAGSAARGLYCLHISAGITVECAFDFSYLRESISTTGTFLGIVKTKALAGNPVTIVPKTGILTGMTVRWLAGVPTVTYLTANRSMYIQSLPVLSFKNPDSSPVAAVVLGNTSLQLKQ